MANERIALVADDDPISRGLVANQLDALGIKSVFTADSGRSALRILASEPAVNLLLTDLKMPDMDGIELLRKLGGHAQSLEVILMSSLGDKMLNAAEQVARGRSLVVLGVAPKPVGRDRLKALLDRGGAPDLGQAEDCAESGIEGDWIREALAGGQYRIAVQPEVEAATLTLHSVEVLSRWDHPKLKDFSPFAVIAAAEEHGLVDEITLAAVKRIGQAFRDWRAQRLQPKIALNVSGVTLTHLSFPEQLVDALGDYGIDSDHVIVEFTETALPSSASDSLDVTSRLMLKGFSLSIDDYGTGYSNLQRLQSLPISQLKIDRAFIGAMLTSMDALKIVKSSVELGHSLGLAVVAEGVENQDILAVCRRLGCDLLQGYHIARPMEPGDLNDWYNAWRSRCA